MQQRSSEQWQEILIEFKSRKISKKEFCELRNIKQVTLDYHLSKERKKKKQSFIPIQTPKTPTVELEFANGLKVSIHA